MAISFSNSFETGLAPGTVITAANSDDGGAGNAFDTVATGFTFDNTVAANGSLSAKLTQAATPASKRLRWNITATDILYGRAYWYLTANPGAALNAVVIVDAVDQVAALVIETTGTVGAYNAAPNYASTGHTTASLTLNAWNRVEWKYDAGDGSTTGRVTIRLYAGNSTTLTEEFVSPQSDFNSQAINVQQGMNNTNANYIYWLDDLALSDADWLGPALAQNTLSWLRA